jgi:hypothetical protein
LNGNRHARSRGDSVIHKNDCLHHYRERGSLAPVQYATSIEHLPHLLRDAFYLLRRDSLHPDDLFIQGSFPSSRNRSEGQFLVPWNAQLMREKDIQRQMQGVCDFKSNGDAATRYSQDKDIASIGKLFQLLCQLPSCVFTILEDHCARSEVSAALP